MNLHNNITLKNNFQVAINGTLFDKGTAKF